MITEIDASLLEKIADLTGKPVGAFNIRKDSGCEARQSTEHIAIDPQPEGKSGIIIRIPADQISKQSRYAGGVKVMRVDEETSIIGIAAVEKEDEEQQAVSQPEAISPSEPNQQLEQQQIAQLLERASEDE